MKLWPSDRFEIETAMSPEEIASLLNSQIAPRRWRMYGSPEKAFVGAASPTGFAIAGNTQYRNSFNPWIRGTFRPGPSGTTVSIQMGLYPLTMAFMWFWFCGLGLTVLFLVASLFSEQGGANPLSLAIPLALAAAGWALMSCGFWYEATRQRARLLDLFRTEGAEKPAQGPPA